MLIPKNKPIRNTKYTNWVKSLNCCNCGMPADDPHHIISEGESGMGMTACDLLTMPLCRGCHTKLHNTPEMWPEQWKWVAKTLQEAMKHGIKVA